MSARGTARSLWLGACLASLFFYPLASAIADAQVYLQWQRANTLELALAFAVISVLLGGLLHASSALRNERLRLLAVLGLAWFPLLCFFVHVARQLGLKDSLIEGAHQLGRGRLGAAAAAAALALLAAVVWRAPGQGRAVVIGLLLVLSPLTAVVWLNLLRHGLHDTLVEIHRDISPGEARRTPPSVFVFVFDELDGRFLYDGREIRDRYPRFGRFAAAADHHHAGLAPGDETLSSMLGLVLGRRLAMVDDSDGRRLQELRDSVRSEIRADENSAFARARRLGYRTALVGWLHRYCELLGSHLDECRSFSIYNYAAAGGGFSLANPVFTNLILLPRQQPFGLLKNPVYSSYQRRVVERTRDAAVASLDAPGPLFVLVHFSIPHLPFVYDGSRFAPPADPFLQDAANYERQLGYVDHLFGRLLDELAARDRLDGSTVAVLSDHGYRIDLPAEKARSVPLIVKRPFQRTRTDADAPFATERLLDVLLDGGGTPASGSATD